MSVGQHVVEGEERLPRELFHRDVVVLKKRILRYMLIKSWFTHGRHPVQSIAVFIHYEYGCRCRCPKYSVLGGYIFSSSSSLFFFTYLFLISIIFLYFFFLGSFFAILSSYNMDITAGVPSIPFRENIIFCSFFTIFPISPVYKLLRAFLHHPMNKVLYH